jgi:CheY-like chemotaxis protein
LKTRVLLAEDNKDTLDVLRRGLEWLNYEIIAAKDGIEAVELATKLHRRKKAKRMCGLLQALMKNGLFL